tara:strand:+ start:2106 stop:2945 length:840 start_codon:yes stop_codon:yes gene_type:complete
MKISILVLLYSCEIEDSKTISTMINSGVDLRNVDLVIWNNGPIKICKNSIKNAPFNILNSVTIYETLENLPLSNIYNRFIAECSADRYIILDHDSTLNDKYLNKSLGYELLDIGVPLITVNGEIKSPSRNIRKGHESGPYSSKDRIVGIGSGIVLSRRMCERVQSKYGNVFDVNFVLYGVDTTFFFRVRESGWNSYIELIDGFEHSLSRLEEESIDVKAFRKFERSVSLGLCFRYYFRHVAILVLKTFIKSVLLRNTLSLTVIFRTFLSGKHPRFEDDV